MDKFILFLIEHYFYSVPLLVVSILLIRSNAIKGGKKITPQDLINLTNQDAAQLIDLRSSNEFDDGHITGSINIPYTDLEDRIHEIKKQEDKSLVLICDTGSQSANAGEVLNKSGFEKTVILSGGIGAWRLDNLPLV
ncbi:rhodanese-like domain-containing protein [Gammaproteobacteria bacterium]|jgi:rhodanese-related sulfurtransferase|nr:rhodanese-like domain-containing protein [Gammaproteobacteria bacterium]MDC0570056.1 rhodanese-like domain-containing protein [bacterium]MDA8733074.1 rhodanese-like domain-containing protein [Gammaproteobacteria bacterium]MDA8815831.1 rhodanese-like domain-containing protein [Gammaproteobacteria bacterium]MDA9804583.1 rhodanese-like domain-containing protein [Gammaproteobacteria bacterium]